MKRAVGEQPTVDADGWFQVTLGKARRAVRARLPCSRPAQHLRTASATGVCAVALQTDGSRAATSGACVAPGPCSDTCSDILSQVVREMLTRLARSHIGGPNKGLGAYAYNVENTVLGSRGLDDWAYFNQTKPMQRDAFTPFH